MKKSMVDSEVPTHERLNTEDDRVLQNLLLVKRIAYHMKSHLPASIQVQDLIQAGMLGLMEAAKHYDSNKGAAFETYAGIRIRGHILDELRNNEWLPRSVYQHMRELSKVVKNIEQREGHEARHVEIAEELHLSMQEYYQYIQNTVGANLYGFDDLGISDGMLPGDSKIAPQPHEQVMSADLAEYLHRLIKKLPKNEQMVLALYYQHELNLKEIGDILEIGESRVCQIHTQAIRRLQTKLH